MTNENKTDLTFSNDWDIIATFGFSVIQYNLNSIVQLVRLYG